MRLLYARCGTVHCIHCDGLVSRDSVDEIAESILALGEGTRLHAIFPVQTPSRQTCRKKCRKIETPAKPAARTRKPREETEYPRSSSADRSAESPPRLNCAPRIQPPLSARNRSIEFSTPESLLDLDFSLPVFVLVDRIVVSAGKPLPHRRRRRNRLSRGRRRSSTKIVPREEAQRQRPANALRFSDRLRVQALPRGREPEPRLFSFNNPFGACPRCQGFGNTIDFDLNLIIPDKSQDLDEGAIDPWNRPKYRAFHRNCKRDRQAAWHPARTPWQDLPPTSRSSCSRRRQRSPASTGSSPMERKKYKLHVRVMLSKYRGYATCPECRGQRLRAEARAVRLSGKNICEAAAMTISAAKEFFTALNLRPMQQEIAGKILEEVRQRLHFLDAVGLEYLTLDRLASHALRRRGAAHPARNLARLAPGRRALRAG